MISTKNLLILLFSLILVTLTQGDEPIPETTEESEKQQVNRREQELRVQNNMTYGNVKVYTFKNAPFDDFVLMPSTDHEYKMEIFVYWKQQDAEVYGASEYRAGEEVRLLIYENGDRILFDRKFYTTTGLSFSGKKEFNYTVRFMGTGQVKKLISMILASPIHIGSDVTTKEHMADSQQRIQNMSNQFKALLTISQRNYLMKQLVAKGILTNTHLYMGYQVLQVFIIIGVALLQVSLLTRLLRGGSIV